MRLVGCDNVRYFTVPSLGQGGNRSITRAGQTTGKHERQTDKQIRVIALATT